MLLSAITPPLSTPNCTTNPDPLFFPATTHNRSLSTATHRTSPPSLSLSLLTTNASTSSSSLADLNLLRQVRVDESEQGEVTVSSASAVARAIRMASTSPVEFVQRIDEVGKEEEKKKVMPSADFQRLCVQQLDLFRRIVHPDALLSVFVRPAGRYVVDRLELHRVVVYPGVDAAPDIVMLCSSFSIPTGLRAAEAAFSSLQGCGFAHVETSIFGGFLVAELPKMELKTEEHGIKQCPLPEESYAFPPYIETKSREIQTLKDHELEMYKFTTAQRLNAINISQSLAMAYVMDQKAMLLQQSSWQNNIRMSNLVEQIRGSLSSIQTLSKMLSLHTKRSEISYDIVEDILVQGEHMRETLQQLQDAVYLTKANIVRYNEETLNKMDSPSNLHPESLRSQLSTSISMEPNGLSSRSRDLEMPMPPLALAPLRQQGIRRPCNVSSILQDLVGAVEPLASKQQRMVELCELSHSLQVDVEEPALRQALSNLIEGALLRTRVGGKVEIVSTGAPAGGALVVIDDDGPDMHYMTQMHSLASFGADLFSEDKFEDNMTWNFVAGLTVAREILESYGCVVRVISPRRTDAVVGAGGTHIELWFPCSSAASDSDGPRQEV